MTNGLYLALISFLNSLIECLWIFLLTYESFPDSWFLPYLGFFIGKDPFTAQYDYCLNPDFLNFRSIILKNAVKELRTTKGTCGTSPIAMDRGRGRSGSDGSWWWTGNHQSGAHLAKTIGPEADGGGSGRTRNNSEDSNDDGGPMEGGRSGRGWRWRRTVVGKKIRTEKEDQRSRFARADQTVGQLAHRILEELPARKMVVAKVPISGIMVFVFRFQSVHYITNTGWEMRSVAEVMALIQSILTFYGFPFLFISNFCIYCKLPFICLWWTKMCVLVVRILNSAEWFLD